MNSKVQFLNSPAFSRLGLPFSEVVRAGDTLYLSGQIGNLPGGLVLAEGGLRGQARQALTNIRNSLEVHGCSLAEVVKCTVMLADMADWADFNEIYVEYFKPPYPARSAFAAAGLALGGRIELEVVAFVGR